MSFALSSPAFPHQGEIPARHTCEGEDISPPLARSRPPEGARSLALTTDADGRELLFAFTHGRGAFRVELQPRTPPPRRPRGRLP